MLALELGTRYGVPLFNGNQRRFQRELEAALRLRQRAPSDPVPVLLLGNSLTLTDLDPELLEEELGPGVQIARWAIDDTNYLDWWFGLRRVYEQGGRPGLVLVGGKSSHFLAGHVRGHYFAHHLLSCSDLFEAAHQTRANANATGSMMLAQASAFYGSREEIYKRVMTWLLPEFPSLGTRLYQPVHRGTPLSDVNSLLAARISELRDLCQQHRSKLVLWLPPTLEPDPHEECLLETARQCNVPVLKPVQDCALPASFFVDGYHLTPRGAREVSVGLAALLRPFIERSALAQDNAGGRREL